MKTRVSLTQKTLSFLLVFILLMQAMGSPLEALGAELLGRLTAAGAGGADPPGTPPSEDQLAQLEPPDVGRNPNQLETGGFILPVYTTSRSSNTNHMSVLRDLRSLLVGYRQHTDRTPERSQFFTGSLLVLTDRDDRPDGVYTGSLPYTEERELMLHPDLTMQGSADRHASYFSSSLELSLLDRLVPDGETIWDYLDRDQVELLVSGNLTVGHGSLSVRANGLSYEDTFWAQERDANGQVFSQNLGEGDAPNNYVFETRVPLAVGGTSVQINYGATRDSIITDPFAALVDDQAPYIKDVRVDMEVNGETDESHLVMTIAFNEGIRAANEDWIRKYADACYVTAYLWNGTAGKEQSVRLYLDKVNGGKAVTFRGSIGRLHYCDFKLTGFIPNYVLTGGDTAYYYLSIGALDLADRMVLGPGKTLAYGNGLQSVQSNLHYQSRESFFLCDHAGNPVSLSMNTWSRQASRIFSHSPRSVEADRISVYNDKTLGVELGEINPAEAGAQDLFVGAGRDLTVFVYLSREIEDEAIWKQIYAELNILDEAGEPLRVYPTSATRYTDNEVYADGEKTGTLLRYENIPMSTAYTLNVAEGAEPLVRVSGLGADYDPQATGYPTVYGYVNPPDNLLYGDFTPPTVAVRSISEGELTLPEADGAAGKTYKRISLEVSIDEVMSHAKAAGLVGESALLTLSGGVESETPILYYMDTGAAASETVADYGSAAVLAPKTEITLGGFTMMNDSVRMYVHILVENRAGSLYLDDLHVGVTTRDLAQNETVTVPPLEIEYYLDTIPPIPAIVTKRVSAADGNTTLVLEADIAATDHSRVDRLLYHFGTEAPDENTPWLTAQIEEFGTSVKATVQKKYGEPNGNTPANTQYSEYLWVKAVDTHGNHSEPVAAHLRLSLEKPATAVKYDGDPTRVSAAHGLLVSGPGASLTGATGYTRVTLTPLKNSDYAYVTVIGTGETDVDVLGLSGLTWYRVKLDPGRTAYTEVSDPLTVESALLEPLVTYYGELKISFENGYGDGDKTMTPKVGALSAEAAAASYFSDPNDYILRFASPLLESLNVHRVDFGAVMDYAIPYDPSGAVVITDGRVVVPDADEIAAPYVFHQVYKGINPMRNAQLHYSIANVAEPTYGLLDLDYENSYAQLMRAADTAYADETEDTVVSTQRGLWATANQYFTIGNTTDDGEPFVSGAYYLRVTVVSRSGHESVYESGKIILDAQTADTAGLWNYAYETIGSITKEDYDTPYVTIPKTATEQAFTDIGITVLSGGETSRSRYFATYSYGVQNLSVVLSTPDSERTYEGVTIGEVEGYKLWNVLSAPTRAEIDAKRFELTPVSGEYGAELTDTLVRRVRSNTIYTSETIPKGIAAMSGLYLVKGTNTFCYQVKLKNGYISPVRYFTITVSDEAPALSVAVDGYQPSLKPSQVDGIINADHVRYRLDAAYSVNGSGRVQVDLWSKYQMNLGLLQADGRTIVDTESPDVRTDQLTVIHSGMQEGEYADFTENSYTSKFPYSTDFWCTGVFVATDEYGGVTMVAPQLGDMDRIDVDEGQVAYGHEVRIRQTGDYFDDPYVIDDSIFRFRILYHQPKYFGAQLLALETYLVEQDENGNEIRIRDIQIDDPSLRYNLFNIQTNDVKLVGGATSVYGGYGRVSFDNAQGILKGDLDDTTYYVGNLEHVLLSGAAVTLSGGHIGDPVTVDFLTGRLIQNGERTDTQNGIGYMYGRSHRDSSTGEYTDLSFYLANPPADETHGAGSTTEVQYTLTYGNAYGDTYTKEGTITLTYADYGVSGVTMTNHGAEVSFSFPVYDPTGVNLGRTGHFQNGSYEITIPDYYGGNRTYAYTVTDRADPNTAITYEKAVNTTNPVTVTLTGTAGYAIVVDVTDYALMGVTGNNTEAVTVTVKENTTFSYRYVDGEGKEQTFFIDVDNILSPDPRPVFDVDLSEYAEDYHVDEDGNPYRYGTVTVYLDDPNLVLRDKYTGRRPTYTFVPGGTQVYTFKAADVEAVLGEETVTLERDVTVRLDLTLREVPEVEFSTDNDTETPNVQVQAYAKRGEAYLNQKLSMQLQGIRTVNPLTKHMDHETFTYVGNRANMAEVLDCLGWSSAYRFTVEVVDSSRVRLFIKEGLYAEAPDFESGVSDAVPGVELSSRLLTVTQNAKFTLFAVDSFNNYASIAFNVTSISQAPVPAAVKIPLSHNAVRVYVMPPDSEGVDSLEILSPATWGVEASADSGYQHCLYVDLSTNDQHKILYRLSYNDVPVEGVLDVSVTEISVDEITEQGQTWSANKTAEATASVVGVDIHLSHNVADILALTPLDASAVRFTVKGRVVKAVYTENHAPISLRITADNGTYVTVNLDEVANIDHSAPVVEVVSEVLAPNGRTLTLTLATNERTLLREGGGRMGEAVETNGVTRYHHTIRITENGRYTYTFIDMSGLMTVYEYETDALVLDAPVILYNTAPSEEGAQDSPDSLALMTGDTVYIKPSRNVTATLSETDAVLTIPGGEWFTLTIPESVGGIPPYVIYSDVYGNIVTHQFAAVAVPDTTPPEIVVSKLTYPVRQGTDRGAVEAELLRNFTAFDPEGGAVTLSVEFTEDLDAVGVTTVIYRAADSEGNQAQPVYGKLRITSVYAPVVSIDGKRLVSDEGINLKSGENVTVSIDSAGIAYELILASGKWTAAQLKSMDALYEGDASSVELGALDDGFYTILIVTEQRDYVRILVAVEDF